MTNAQKTIFDCLIGETIEAFKLNDDKTIFCFKTLKSSFSFVSTGDCCAQSWIEHVVSTGDCCAQSWIEHVNGLNWLIGSEVTKVIERAYQYGIEKSDMVCVDVFGYTFETTKGRFDIEFRGEHNGYYSCFVEPLFGTHELNDIESDF